MKGEKEVRLKGKKEGESVQSREVVEQIFVNVSMKNHGSRFGGVACPEPKLLFSFRCISANLKPCGAAE